MFLAKKVDVSDVFVNLVQTSEFGLCGNHTTLNQRRGRVAIHTAEFGGVSAHKNDGKKTGTTVTAG